MYDWIIFACTSEADGGGVQYFVINILYVPVLTVVCRWGWTGRCIIANRIELVGSVAEGVGQLES